MAADYLCYTDGSCKAGEGAPGGWGYFIRPPLGAPLEGYGKARKTLAKVMEYTAVAQALEALPSGVSATVFADNQSLVENFQRHLAGWRENGFAKVDPTIVEIVRRIDASIATKTLSVSWQWVRSHRDNSGNNRADELAAQGAREAKAELKAEERALEKSRVR